MLITISEMDVVAHTWREAWTRHNAGIGPEPPRRTTAGWKRRDMLFSAGRLKVPK